MRAKIQICQLKQADIIEETKSVTKELNGEKRKFRVIEEQFQRQLDQQLKRKETSRVVLQTYEYSIMRLKKDLEAK